MAFSRAHLLLITPLLACLAVPVSSQTPAVVPQTNTTGPSYTVGSAGDPAAGTNTTQSCRLEAIEELQIRDDLGTYLASGAKLIEIDLTVEGRPANFLDKIGGHVFRGSHWIRSTSRRGRNLLMLEENYDILSLHLLSIGVEKMAVRLREVPAGCLSQTSANDTEALLRELLLNDFASSAAGSRGSLSKDEHVCNVHVLEEGGRAAFHYSCCHRVDSVSRCTYVDRDIWISLLLACVLIIKVLVVLFSPNFIPASFYSEEYTAREYVYNAKDKKQIRVVITKFPSSYTGKSIVKLSALADMKYFRRTLSMMHMDKLYDVEIDKVRLAVKGRRLLAENEVPVGFLQMIYANIMRCRIRKLPSLEACCHRSICGSLSPSFKDNAKPVLPWYKFLRATMRMILLLLLMVPWLLRLAAYYTYEGERAERKRQAATDRSLDVGIDFRGSFTIVLTPIHGIFIAIYVIVLIDSLFYGVIRKRMKNKFKLVLRKCLRDMRGRSRLDVCGWATRLMLKPFELFGLFGVLLVIPFLLILSPLLIVVLVFYMVPFINLSFRLIIHMFIFMCPNRFNDMMDGVAKRMDRMKERLNLGELSEQENFEKKKDISTCDVLMHIFILVMCLLSFWSVTFLLMECLSFFVEIGVYTLVGIIVNADVTVRYLTVLFFLYLYADSCLGGVSKMYVAFHNSILSELVKRNRKALEKVASEDAEVQDDTVFRVKGYTPEPPAEGEALPPEVGEPNVPEAKFFVKKGIPFWHTRSFLVFLDSKDQPRSPEKFFHEIIMMPYCGCPGSVVLNYFKALIELLKIFIFLIFVVIVVMAFGDAYTISSTNQMLATVAGGFLPFVFRNVFKSGGGPPSLDTESLQFQSEFNNVITKFEQGWPIWDLVPTPNFREVTNRFSLSADIDMSQFSASTPDESKGENSHNFADGVTLNLDEPQVDLIVDLSTFNERHFGEMARSATTGSISMLADSGRGAEDVRIYRGPTEREREIV